MKKFLILFFILIFGSNFVCAKNLFRTREQYNQEIYEFGTYDGYEDYNKHHPNGDKYYCIKGIVVVETPSGIRFVLRDDGINPRRCVENKKN